MASTIVRSAGHWEHDYRGKSGMRPHVPIIAFCLAASSQYCLAQTQQGQRRTSASAPASVRQLSEQAGTPTTVATPKSDAKSPVVLTNENINDSAAKKANPSSAPAAQSDPKAAPKQDPPAPSQEQNPQAGAPAAKPKLQLEPHKVLDNENLPNVLDKQGVNVVGTAAGLEGIYDCDVNCYNQVRASANVYPLSDLSWMRELHDGIEKLQDDGKWRAFLVSLVDIRERYCKLAQEESSALRRIDNEQNVTNEQINIREEYNRKVAELSQESAAAYNRAGLLQAGYSPLVRSFMQLQEQRISGTGCRNAGPYYYNSDPDEL